MSQNLTSQSLTEPGRVERDLDQTRSRLSGHLGELQQRLTPGQVIDDLMRYFRGKEGADFGRSLLESVRGNPLPAAITGVGLTWLMASNTRPGTAGHAAPSTSTTGKLRVYNDTLGYNQGGRDAMTARVRAAEQDVTRGKDEAEPLYAGRLDVARGQALGLARHGEESTESFSQRVRSALASAQQAVTEKAHDLQDHASGAAGAVGSAAQGAGQAIGNAAQRAGGAMAQGGQAVGQAGGDLVTKLTETPVLLGALGLAAGALLGALLPHLEQEEAALGGIAGQTRETIKSLAQGAVDKGSHVAQAVLDKGSDSAEAHGLTGAKGPGQLVDAAMSGDLAKDLKQVAADVLQSGDDAVRKQTLDSKSS